MHSYMHLQRGSVIPHRSANNKQLKFYDIITGWTPHYECTRQQKGIMFEKVEKRLLPYQTLQSYTMPE